ncbi:hypothetical protein CsatA_013202 [Cannabis sativa]
MALQSSENPRSITLEGPSLFCCRQKGSSELRVLGLIWALPSLNEPNGWQLEPSIEIDVLHCRPWLNQIKLKTFFLCCFEYFAGEDKLCLSKTRLPNSKSGWCMYCLNVNNDFFLQLPRMLKEDAIAEYYGLHKGQVVKISYTGGISNSYVTYRCVW